jgi:predicted amidohydrolase
MAILQIGLLQMQPVYDGEDAAAAKGEEFCRQARERGADIALFPEMWNIGYSFPDASDPEAVARWMSRAAADDSEYVLRFRRLAAELGMGIAVTCLQAWPGAPRNAMHLIDRHGEIALTYAKMHTCDFGAESLLTAGEDFPVCALDTAAGEVRVGAMVCYDREFPETARILMLRGAELILTPNACNLEIDRLSQFRARAYENMVAVAMANYAAPRCNGHSVAFSGISGERVEGGRDMLVVEAGEEESVYLASIDLDALRAYRKSEPWGDAFRHPSLYGALTEPAVRPPFIRKSARNR